ncbi:MAG: SAM-dependent methyltransferase [Fuerstiella sp.]|nr:SAM-dependent methyltransferase [Fuerstiella sp.]
MNDDAENLFDVIESGVGEGTLQRVVLSQPTRRSQTTTNRVEIRPIMLKEKQFYQWSGLRGSQAFHENHDPQAILTALRASIGISYRHIHLAVEGRQWSARFSRRGKCRLIQEKHASTPSNSSISTDHNRKRQYLIPEGQPVPFLVQTGIMTPTGQVRSRHFHKFRQINRYVEFIADVVDKLPHEDVIHIVDFGCGKSYLTFATHYYLTQIAQRRVAITGLDRRNDVVQTCHKIVESLGLVGIHFEQGDISTYSPSDHIHLVVSLHACNTATDDAISQAVRWGTDVILSVPCCQHELNAVVKAGQIPLLSRHGILQERFCALTTDAVRSALLEQVGYQTQVLEFVDMEHTAKNLLIRAVRRNSNSESPQLEQVTHELKQFCSVFQIPDLHLQRRLQEFELLQPPADIFPK